MRDLCIDLPDLSIQYEAMLTYLRQHGIMLVTIKDALKSANVSEIDFEMDWIRDMWNCISLTKYTVTMTRTVEVWATDKANAKELAAEKEVDTTFEIIEA